MRVLSVIIGRMLWLLTIVGAGLAALQVGYVMMRATGAPQEASGTALALAFAIIPYVLARGWDEFTKPGPEDLPTRRRKAAPAPPAV